MVRFILVSSVLQGLFVYCLLSSLRIFQSWGDITVADEGLQNLGLFLVYSLDLIVPLELTITDLIFLLCINCVKFGFSLICLLLRDNWIKGIIFTIWDMLMSYVFIVKVCKQRFVKRSLKFQQRMDYIHYNSDVQGFKHVTRFYLNT